MPLDEKQLAEALRTGMAVSDHDFRIIRELKQFSDGRLVGLSEYGNVYFCGASQLSPYVEPKPVTERWANVYPNGIFVSHESEESADYCSTSDRIGLVHFSFNPNNPPGQRVTVREIALEESK